MAQALLPVLILLQLFVVHTVENAPSGGDSWLRVGQFDPIAKASKFTDHSPGTLALRVFANGWTSFLVTDSLVQNLPDQVA